MTATPSRIAELTPELEQIATAAGCELLHVELKGGILRLVLDKPDGGVNLEDCQHVSKQASALLDVLDFGKSRYVLEVTSPGPDRQLYRPRDYERFPASSRGSPWKIGRRARSRRWYRGSRSTTRPPRVRPRTRPKSSSRTTGRESGRRSA